MDPSLGTIIIGFHNTGEQNSRSLGVQCQRRAWVWVVTLTKSLLLDEL